MYRVLGLATLHDIKYLVGCMVVQSRRLLFSHHGKGFPTASLPIGKAGDFGFLESSVNQRLDCILVYILI